MLRITSTKDDEQARIPGGLKGTYIERSDHYPNKELIVTKKNTVPNWDNGKRVEYTTDVCGVLFTYETDADLIELYLKGRYLKSLGKTVDLYIKYLPYSRMDRTEGDEQAPTLKYIADLINSVGFDRVIITEPHSDVCMALINNSIKVEFVKMLLERIERMDVDFTNAYFMFPDATALKRYEHYYPNKYFLGLKNRDFKTGKITNYRLVPPDGGYDTAQEVYIIDDLCAKGTTALNAGRELQKLGFKNIYLLVAHCEDSIFDGELLKDDSPIKVIYTSNTIIRRAKHKKIMEI